MENIQDLVSVIAETQQFFKQQAQKQVNIALTLRNWMFGFYIAEYELNGADRAVYGQRILKEISDRTSHIPGMSERNLYLFKSFHLAHPQILRTVTAKSYFASLQQVGILQTLSAKFDDAENTALQIVEMQSHFRG